MNIYVQQSIYIQTLSVGSVSNSSVLQIGTAGTITPSAHLYNTGQFTKPAPNLSPGTFIMEQGKQAQPILVPLGY